MPTVNFTLRTLISDTTFYITYGNMNCIKSKEVPESITETHPGSGKVHKNDNGTCINKNGKIHLYFWVDSEHSKQLADIRLLVQEGDAQWSQDVLSVADGYELLATTSDINEFSFTLVLSDDT